MPSKTLAACTVPSFSLSSVSRFFGSESVPVCAAEPSPFASLEPVLSDWPAAALSALPSTVQRGCTFMLTMIAEIVSAVSGWAVTPPSFAI